MKLITALVLMIASLQLHAEVVVIVHPSNSNSFTSEEVESLFMTRKSTFADGGKVTPYYLVANDAVRNQFDEKVLGKSTSQLKAYWSKLVFTGKGTPPTELANSAEAVAKVANDPTAIAYADKSAVTDGVKVVLTLP